MPKYQKSYLNLALRFLHLANDPMVWLKHAYESISFDPNRHSYRHSTATVYPWRSDYLDPAHLSMAEIEIISNYHAERLGKLWMANIALEAQQGTAFRYSDFGIFEKRIRELKFHMDSQKPRGFRQLWRDRRDALNYDTFWGIIIFGASTLFLEIVSLAVSAAQAVAAFKALNMSPSGH